MLKGQATKEQIAELKKVHGQVFKYEVDGRVCYLRSVDRNLYAQAAAKVSTSPAKFNETIINGIWLAGDDAIKTEDQYYFGLIDFVEEFMAKKKGSLESC